MVGFNFCIPLICIPFGSTSTGLPSICRGEYFKVFFLENNIHLWLSDSSLFEKAWVWSWTVIIFLWMSNIPDFYFVYSGSREVEKSDENVKHMMTKEAYLKRKR